MRPMDLAMRALARAWRVLLGGVLAASLLAGCGGGGSSNPAPSAPAAGTTPAATGGNGAAATQAAGGNVVPVTISSSLSSSPNLPFVNVTICVPGTATCQTIDRILVDTGSIGLRVFASALNPALALPAQLSANGLALGECTQFADGFTWGPVRQADFRIGGEQASNLPVNILADPAFNEVPVACSSGGSDINSVSSFGANGVLGVGLFVEDCGPGCERSADFETYYACGTNCESVALALANQVRNPVASFARNNNGVILSFPSVPYPGTASVTGAMTFGIGTQPNNGLGAATVITVSPNTGYFTTVYKGRSFSRGFIDSGSNGIFFRDTTIARCRTSFYCPPQTLNLSAVNQGTNGQQSTVTFDVVNTDAVFSQDASIGVVPGLASSLSSTTTFDWGLPFFLGRNVTTAIDGRATPAGNGPYYAY
ncbi:DUF3443 domain-containing protein [Noviherbaspirillum galbum]|uniref:DUF3443 domain-containing protein n=1 Tax=Noviherbaspirillum galbum TaxID=2709383 RepID=A0A6B3SFP2_9BURK|nr:DUF3443 domain-containing protein [Noviherbaspirillum galbum]NEX59674.1 DUF3443 domain-containing protein [Noviherbaspirillum galbum]